MARVPHNKGRGLAAKWLGEHIGYRGEKCLIWPFSKDAYYGRGRLGLNGEILWAHRAMCQLVHGPAPSDKHQSAHTCGNGHRGCVNPNHLAWKTNSENQRDRRKHGTHLGSKGSRTPLTRAQIADIRASKGKESQLKTAARLGIKRGTVEYWQSHDREPKPPGTSRMSIWRRERRRVSSQQSTLGGEK